MMYTRTVKRGQVKIRGRFYRPSGQHLKYDGRLDGKRLCFATYELGGKMIASFIALWGTKGALRNPALAGIGPHVVGGTFPWYWWNEAPTPPPEPGA